MDFFDIQLIYSLKDKIGMYEIDLTTEELEQMHDICTMRLIEVKQERLFMSQNGIKTCKDILEKLEECCQLPINK